MKNIEAMIESQQQKLKMMDSQFPQNSQIQEPYSMCQVSQEEPMDLGRSIENLIQSENNFFQSIDRLEEQMSRYINIMNERIRKLYLTHVPPFLIALAILIRTKNDGALETLTKIQFYHKTLNLTNFKP